MLTAPTPLFFQRPSVCSAILVELCLDPVEPGALPVWWDADPDTRGEMSFSLGDHELEVVRRPQNR